MKNNIIIDPVIIRRTLVLLWTVVFGLFLLVQIIRVSQGKETTGGIASELAVLAGVLGCAIVGGRSIGERRFLRAGIACVVMLAIDLGCSFLLGIRDRPFLFPSSSSVGSIVVILILWIAAAPYLKRRRMQGE